MDNFSNQRRSIWNHVARRRPGGSFAGMYMAGSADIGKTTPLERASVKSPSNSPAVKRSPDPQREQSGPYPTSDTPDVPTTDLVQLSRGSKLTVANVMTREVGMVGSMEPISRVVANMRHHKAPFLFVVNDEGFCLGTLCYEDLPSDPDRPAGENVHRNLPVDLRTLSDEAQAFQVTAAAADSAGAFMNPATQGISAEDSVERAAQIMNTQARKYLPVLTNDDRPIGIITSADLLIALADSLHSDSSP